MVLLEIDLLFPSSTRTVALKPLTFSGQRIELYPKRVFVVRKLLGDISSVTPEREIV